jgi:transcription elongation factor Elf1
MWCVDPPDLDVGDTFTTCISRVSDTVKNNNLKTRFEGILPAVIASSDEFEAYAEAGEMFQMPQHDNVGGTISKNDMIGLYNGRFAKKNGPGRSIYTKIKLLPEHDRCPFCDHRDVSTLDHVLPKALFPVLAVTPLNLVGSCKDCNEAKRTQAPSNAADAVLHPYFDDVSDQTWLRARVVESEVCAVLFRVKHRDEWSDDKNARLKAQFKTLGLNKLYASQAAREISGIRDSLIRKFDAGGAQIVRRELRDQWNSRRVDRRNCWQTALYRALSRSEWYCEGGFRLGQ